jgi:hypothetical protein
MDQAGFHVVGLPHARAPRLSPLARGIFYRLAWALGLSAILWLAVIWALA